MSVNLDIKYSTDPQSPKLTDCYLRDRYTYILYISDITIYTGSQRRRHMEVNEHNHELARNGIDMNVNNRPWVRFMRRCGKNSKVNLM